MAMWFVIVPFEPWHLTTPKLLRCTMLPPIFRCTRCGLMFPSASGRRKQEVQLATSSHHNADQHQGMLLPPQIIRMNTRAALRVAASTLQGLIPTLCPNHLHTRSTSARQKQAPSASRNRCSLWSTSARMA